MSVRVGVRYVGGVGSGGVGVDVGGYVGGEHVGEQAWAGQARREPGGCEGGCVQLCATRDCMRGGLSTSATKADGAMV